MSKPIEAVCPECEYVVDDATELGPGKDRPEPGDLALCIRCSAPSFYVDNGETLGLRPASPEEKVLLSQDRRVMRTRTLIQKAASQWFG